MFDPTLLVLLRAKAETLLATYETANKQL